jgi:hypothetical protein
LRESYKRFSIINGLARPEAIFLKAGIETLGFFRGSFAKNQEIINKKEVVDSRGILGYFQPFDVA